jgi:phosphatidylglycerol lysyltransferase
LAQLARLSDEWLRTGGHKERGFALGYFDEDYLQQSNLHLLRDDSGVVAFANELPLFRGSETLTIDLLRYDPAAQDAMPFLLAQVLHDARVRGYERFDLGFVPFAASKGALVRVAVALSSSRFSAKGLEQFKNKFQPDWQPNYLAYDGDMADLALIALNLEKAMKP